MSPYVYPSLVIIFIAASYFFAATEHNTLSGFSMLGAFIALSFGFFVHMSEYGSNKKEDE